MFTFCALGTRDEITGQLAEEAPASKLGEAARQLVLDAVGGDTDAPPGEGREVRYVVRASGHDGGGEACSLTLTIEPLTVSTGQPPF